MESLNFLTYLIVGILALNSTVLLWVARKNGKTISLQSIMFKPFASLQATPAVSDTTQEPGTGEPINA